MPVDADIVRASYELNQSIKIRASSPFDALVSLKRNKSAPHLDFNRENGVESCYLPDAVAFHRGVLRLLPTLARRPYDTEKYEAYKGIKYPLDLSMVPGLWLIPLEFSFNNLVVLNTDMTTAIYWAIPILKATSGKFRRLIIQRIEEFLHMPFAFPYTELDHCLVTRPHAKVIMIYGHEASKKAFTRGLPLLNLKGHLNFIKEGKLVLFI